MKIIKVSIASLLFLVLMTGLVFSQTAWEVTEDPPTPIGPLLAQGHHNDDINPEVSLVASDDGLLQAVFEDQDPKCDEKSGYVGVDSTVHPVPRAPILPGDTCEDPVDGLSTSRVFLVKKGNVLSGEQGDSSGDFSFFFATLTPGPVQTNTPTATAVATAVATNAPTNTPTNTPKSTVDQPTPFPTSTSAVIGTMTPTSTPKPDNTPVPTITPTATLTEAVEPPETVVPPPHCVKAVPEKLYDGTYLIWVNAVNPIGYTLFDGVGYLYFEKQPIPLTEMKEGVLYRVVVGEGDSGCTFQVEPTSLPTDDQIPGLFRTRIPFITS